VDAYTRDVGQLCLFLENSGIDRWSRCKASDIALYMRFLQHDGVSESSIQRKISALRKFFDFLYKRHLITEAIAHAFDAPKTPKKKPDVLHAPEISALLRAPDTRTEKGLRDRAILELICATGIKASELISLNSSDILIDNSVIKCGQGHSKRVVPLNAQAKKYIKKYAQSVRPLLSADKREKAFFLNMSGERLTRQGICKILRGYAEECGLKDKVTPNSLRYAFAQMLVKKGVKVDSIQSILGHADKSTTQAFLQNGGLALGSD